MARTIEYIPPPQIPAERLRSETHGGWGHNGAYIVDGICDEGPGLRLHPDRWILAKRETYTGHPTVRLTASIGPNEGTVQVELDRDVALRLGCAIIEFATLAPFPVPEQIRRGIK